MPKSEALSTEDFSDEMIESVKNCLQEKEEEIDYFVDSAQWGYETAQITTLVKYLGLDAMKAKKVLKEAQKRHSKSSKKIEAVESSVTEILENPRDDLVEDFITAYENFCKDYAIEANGPIPEKLRDTVIFEFPVVGENIWQIPLWLAHFLVKSRDRKRACQEFFESAGNIDVSKTLFKI